MRQVLAGMMVAGIMLGLSAQAAQADAAQCDTRIEGEEVTIFFSPEEVGPRSWRERYLSRDRSCPAAVVITYLTPDLTAEQREVFCANYDSATRSHSMPAQGPRDASGRCLEPSKTCTMVNTTRREAMELMGLGEEVEEGQRSRLSQAVSAVTHSSGAMILSGNAGTLTGLVGSAGSALGTALAAPGVLAGAAASLVVIGGAVYLCSDADARD